MSDVPLPLLKKRIYIKSVESNRNTITWKVNPTGIFSKDIGDLFYETDVRDALRKFQDFLETCPNITISQTNMLLNRFNEVFGVLEEKGSDSP